MQDLQSRPTIRAKLKEIADVYPDVEGGTVYRVYVVSRFERLADEVTGRQARVAVVDEAKMAEALEMLQRAKLLALESITVDTNSPPKGYFVTNEGYAEMLRFYVAAFLFLLLGACVRQAGWLALL